MLDSRGVGRGRGRARSGAIAEAATAQAAAPGAQVEFGNEGGHASADGYRNGRLRVGRDRGGRVLQTGRGRAAVSVSAVVVVVVVTVVDDIDEGKGGAQKRRWGHESKVEKKREGRRERSGVVD